MAIEQGRRGVIIVRRGGSGSGAAATFAARLLTVLFGGLFVAVGSAVVAIALGYLPARMAAPAWVVACAGAVFIAGGGLVIFEALPLSAAFRKALYVLFLAALAAPFHWTAFGPGDREFTRTSNGGGVEHTRPASETGGRIAFGIGAVVLDAVIVASLLSVFRRRGRDAMDAPTVPRTARTLPGGRASR